MLLEFREKLPNEPYRYLNHRKLPVAEGSQSLHDLFLILGSSGSFWGVWRGWLGAGGASDASEALVVEWVVGEVMGFCEAPYVFFNPV